MPLLAFYAAVVVINAEVSLCLDTRHTEQHGLHQLTVELHLQDETIKKACVSEDQDFTITAALADQAAVDLSKVPSHRSHRPASGVRLVRVPPIQTCYRTPGAKRRVLTWLERTVCAANACRNHFLQQYAMLLYAGGN